MAILVDVDIPNHTLFDDSDSVLFHQQIEQALSDTASAPNHTSLLTHRHRQPTLLLKKNRNPSMPSSPTACFLGGELVGATSAPNSPHMREEHEVNEGPLPKPPSRRWRPGVSWEIVEPWATDNGGHEQSSTAKVEMTPLSSKGQLSGSRLIKPRRTVTDPGTPSLLNETPTKGSSKGKKPLRNASPDSTPPPTPPKDLPHEKPSSTCGICQEPFFRTFNPVKVSLAPSSSSRAQRLFGLALPCPGSHDYCIDCMTSYLRVKLEDGGGDGAGIFPIRCPECPANVQWEVDDDTAAKVLGQDLLDVWHFQKLLAAVAKFYCPNPKCSVPIETPLLDDVIEAECPSCREKFCFKCKALWHEGQTCEDFKSPGSDDELLARLARRNHWRKCSKCGALVERTEGCPHMTCRCRHQFCHLCGAEWIMGCSRPGGCVGDWVDDDWSETIAQHRGGNTTAARPGQERIRMLSNFLSRLRMRPRPPPQRIHNVQWRPAPTAFPLVTPLNSDALPMRLVTPYNAGRGPGTNTRAAARHDPLPRNEFGEPIPVGWATPTPPTRRPTITTRRHGRTTTWEGANSFSHAAPNTDMWGAVVSRRRSISRGGSPVEQQIPLALPPGTRNGTPPPPRQESPPPFPRRRSTPPPQSRQQVLRVVGLGSPAYTRPRVVVRPIRNPSGQSSWSPSSSYSRGGPQTAGPSTRSPPPSSPPARRLLVTPTREAQQQVITIPPRETNRLAHRSSRSQGSSSSPPRNDWTAQVVKVNNTIHSRGRGFWAF